MISHAFRNRMVRRALSTAPYPPAALLPAQEVADRVCSVANKKWFLTPSSPASTNSVDVGQWQRNMSGSLSGLWQLDSLQVKSLIDSWAEEFCVSIPTSEAENLTSLEAAVKYFHTNPRAR